MKNSTSTDESNIPKETLKKSDKKLITDSSTRENLTLEEIKNLIIFLKKREVECHKDNRYVEAELCKKKINEFEQLEEDTLYKNLIYKINEENKKLESEQLVEINSHNQKFDLQLINLNKEFELANQKLHLKHDKEFKEEIEKIKSSLPKKIKPTSELIKLSKQMDSLGKARDYINAHQIQIQIAEISQQEKINHFKNNEKRFEIEVLKVKTKQANETAAIHQKMTSMFNEFKKIRALEFDLLVRRSKNQKKELEQKQMNELNKFKLLQAKVNITKSSSRQI